MNPVSRRKILPISNIVVLGLLLLSQGCTSITENFTSSEIGEIKPFARKTVEVLVVEDVQVRDDELLHLRRYVDETFVELDELQRHVNRVRQYRNKLVEYSLDLVRLSEQFSEESERIAAYASHLEQIVGEAELNQIDISEQEWNEILEKIRNQQTFLHALRSFQPVIAAASETFDELITKIKSELVVATRKEFDRRIEANFREVNELLSILRGKRKELLAAMIALERYRDGDQEAIAGFRKTNVRLSEIFTSDTPNENQLTALESDLRERIRNSTLLIAELDSDYANYVKVRVELDRKEVEVLEALTTARLQIETWTRAHFALAKGVKKPGELMQLTVKTAKQYLIP